MVIGVVDDNEDLEWEASIENGGLATGHMKQSVNEEIYTLVVIYTCGSYNTLFNYTMEKVE